MCNMFNKTLNLKFQVYICASKGKDESTYTWSMKFCYFKKNFHPNDDI